MSCRGSAERSGGLPLLAMVLLLCALAGRLALGAIVPGDPAATAASLARLQAATILCGTQGHDKPAPPAPHPACPEDQLLIELAGHGLALNPSAPPLPQPVTLRQAAAFAAFAHGLPPAIWRGLPETRAPPPLA